MCRYPQISVIIPVYNADKFLNYTIPSVLNQSFSSIELILVNDGSTDNSLEICLKFAQKDSRIKVIDKTNGGANPARGKGVEIARGEFIYFMDADDSLGPEELQTLYVKIGNADLLMSGCKDEYTFGKLDYIKAILNHQIPLRLCGHLYRRVILESTFFNTPEDLRMGEDMLSNLMIAKNLTLFKSTKFTQYQIDWSNSSSISRSFVRSASYEQMFDEMLTSIVSKLLNSRDLDSILAIQRFNTLKFLLIEQKYLNTENPFIIKLFANNKFLPKKIYIIERFIMNIKPLAISASLLRYWILFNRKYNSSQIVLKKLIMCFY